MSSQSLSKPERLLQRDSERNFARDVEIKSIRTVDNVPERVCQENCSAEPIFEFSTSTLGGVTFSGLNAAAGTGQVDDPLEEGGQFGDDLVEGVLIVDHPLAFLSEVAKQRGGFQDVDRGGRDA